jgi:outer membrane protein assembly factor BamB
MRRVPLLLAALVLTGAALAVPRAPVSAAAASATTLTASAASVTQDSWVTFTATVTTGSGTPTGTVTFTDTSNGSVLDTAALAAGTAVFPTAALAAGTRSIVATYSGSGSASPSSSAALGITVTAAGSRAVAFQTDARHDGHQAHGALTASSLTRKWSRTLGVTPEIPGQAMVSYPLIARGRVFVTASHHGYQLYALNASNGTTDWSVGLGNAIQLNGVAYDGQRIFVLDFSGLLTAYVAGTGREVWVTQMPGEWSFSGAPTAYDGVVYVTGSGYGGTVYAVSEADGRVRMDTDVNGGDGTPAVDSTGMYVSYGGPVAYRFSLAGRLVWEHSGCCSGGGGSTPALYGSYVYARGAWPLDTPLILSKSLGARVAAFASDTAPAFGSKTMYTLYGGNLVAASASGGPKRWTFKNGSLVTAPLVNNGVVYVGSSGGRVYGVSARSGARIWSAAAGPYMSPVGAEAGGPPIGMAIGGGRLVVPAGNVLTAFGN